MNGTVAIYTRTSLEDYDKSHQLLDQSCSIVNQKLLIHSFINENTELSAMQQIEYADDGFTGTNFDRPSFQEMLEAARQGQIQCIVVKDLSRLGRSYLEVGDYLERIFPSIGIRFISVTDGYDSRAFKGATGGLDIAFRNFIYDSYSRDLSAKVKSAMQVRMEKGKFVNHPPYGYLKSSTDKHQLLPDPETAPIVQEIFQMALEGKKTSETAKELNRRRVPTPLQYKQHKIKADCQDRALMWSHSMVLNILKNYKYTGAMVNHTRESRTLRDRTQRRTSAGEWIITEGAHEALVTKEEFETVQKCLYQPAKGKRQPQGAKDNVFFCGCCGRKLRKTHGRDTYFSCNTPMYQENAACAGIRWSKTALESALLPVYRTQLRLLGEQATAVNHQAPLPDLHTLIEKLAQLEASIQHCDSLKMQLFEEFHDGKLDRNAFLAKKQAVAQRQSLLRTEYAQCQEQHIQQVREVGQQQREQAHPVAPLSESVQPEETELEKMYAAIERVIVFDNQHIEVRWKLPLCFT